MTPDAMRAWTHETEPFFMGFMGSCTVLYTSFPAPESTFQDSRSGKQGGNMKIPILICFPQPIPKFLLLQHKYLAIENLDPLVLQEIELRYPKS